MDPRPDAEAHFLCLHQFAMHARERDFDQCMRYIRRRAPCSPDAGQARGSGANWVATMLLGPRWQSWEPEKMARSLELLRLYVDAGYVPADQLLAPVGLDPSPDISPYLRRTRRLPLASALFVEDAEATVLLIERGDLAVNDLREQLAQYLAHEGLDPVALSASDEPGGCLRRLRRASVGPRTARARLSDKGVAGMPHSARRRHQRRASR